MSVVLRTGAYGNYWGSLQGSSEPLTESQMTTNAFYIYNALIDHGWVFTPICALLGNMEHESGLNPGRWQSDDVGNTSRGYGLVQWTPASKYIDWCSTQNLSDYTTMDNNIARILYEVENGLQWIPTTNYNFTFEQFTKNVGTVQYLSRAFLLNYERPADQSESVQEKRSNSAVKWFTTIYGEAPPPDSGGGSVTPTTKKKRDTYNFVLFNRRRRMKQW